MARIHHIATWSDWEQARRTGTYTTSTAGRTLAEEGFIHACRREQVQDVFDRYYAGGREPLVLLTIDPERLTSEVREEAVGAETYPHIHGPLNRSAVVGVEPLNRHGGTDSFLMTFIKLMARRMAIATVVMVAIAVVLVAASMAMDR
ncbi:MAG: DUF952 domain-containing protein [Nocardioides sp.]|nr:DUF952 domain-containing protein [Nocardioides sp.]